MHNLLIDRFPEAVTVDGRAYPVRTGFRIGMLFEMLAWDAGLSARDKVCHALRLYYVDGVPLDMAAAYRAVVWFFAGGRDLDADAGDEGGQAGRRLYDYEVDAALLYAAFWDQYGLDLQEADLHWWKFRALMAGLRPEHAFSRRVAVRGVNLAQVEDRQERARLARLKARYRLDGEGDTQAMMQKAGALFAG